MRGRASALLVALVALSAASAQTDMGTDEQREAGRVLYDKYCSQCHGVDGAGDGIAEPRVKPKPRDFTSGKFKLRTTPSGALPSDADIARSIRNGLPYTSMPGWSQLSNQEVQNLVYYLKTFSEDFANADKHAEAMEIPEPPPFSVESAEQGRQVYEQMGCIQCHGRLGRGDGPSAPTLKDDWGYHIRPADMTMPWTFRGGPTRSDVFRTFTTGLNGTPMPAYAESIELEDRWHLVNYIASLSEGEGEDPGYDNLIVVSFVELELDLEDGAELFAGAPTARFPLVGQVMEPGRNFHPATTSVEIQAVYNRREVAIRVVWHDMRAEISGRNDPTLEVPRFEESDEAGEAGGAEDEGGDDFWGDDAEQESGDDFWGDDDEQEGSDDFWGDDDAGDEGDFWGEEEAGEATLTPDTEFSDAVSLQFPQTAPGGIRKPYFISGDGEHPVDIWFVDLARKLAQQHTGRGSGNLEPHVGDDIEVVGNFEDGEWSVILKRGMKSPSGISFEPARYMPIAVSVWDGFNRERGNKRAMSLWQYLYFEPAETVSPVGPMIRAGLVVLVAELLVIGWVRRRYSGARPRAADGSSGKTLIPEIGMTKQTPGTRS